MKKHLLFALGVACAATCLTACHDSDDEDDSDGFTATFSSPYIQYLPINTLSSYAGVTAYALSDDEHKIDVYHFSTDDLSQYLDTTGETRIASKHLEPLWNGFYGGFTPTYFSANNTEEYAVPMCGEFHSGSSALICNPGMACRSVFSKHYPMEMNLTNAISAAAAALTLGDASSLYVCPTDYYTALIDSSYRTALSIEALPANHRIEFVVYGYVEHFSFSNMKELISTTVTAAKQVGDGGTECSDVKVIAETDDKSNVTINKDWQKVDLSSIGHCYLLEAYIRVVDKSTGKTSKTYSIDASTNSNLGYVLVDDISFETKGILGSLL